VVVGAGGEEAAQLGRVTVHGRVRVQGKTENFEIHSSKFNAAALCMLFNGDKIIFFILFLQEYLS